MILAEIELARELERVGCGVVVKRAAPKRPAVPPPPAPKPMPMLSDAVSRQMAEAHNFLESVGIEDRTKIDARKIQRIVAAYYGITRDDILSSRRTAFVAEPRHLAMFLLREFSLKSLPEIGRRFGNRDHTTVLYAVRKIAEMIEADPQFRAKVDEIRLLISQEAG